ncbi:MAG: hypothetical protein ACTHJR_15300 [Sphingomonas sp.]|uniref:hypothetical protein n=1 Tax=Sphingomonas sp. TaxID=28214 RepID=UPI003F8042AD
MIARLRWFGLGAAVAALMAGVAAYGAVDHNRRWLVANLQPAVLDRATWCWQDRGAEAEIAGSESRRDALVIRTALLGATGFRSVSGDADSIVSAQATTDRDAGRLGYVYALFWTAPERKRLFDHVAASRPVCSPGFGGAATRSAG